MTLREKFDWYLSGGEDCPESIECEQIADDYAIDFGRWLNENDGACSYAELLEIFKKEKGL